MIAASPKEDSRRKQGLGRQALISLAEITVELVGLDLELKVAGMMDRFLVEAGQPEVTITARWGEPDDDRKGRLLFDSGSHWQLYRLGEDYLFRLAGPLSNWRPYKRARFNDDFTRGDIVCSRLYYAQDEPLYPLDYPLDEVLFAHLLAMGRGVELHACGLVDGASDGYLFVGQSGAGKTTMARIWERHAGAKILSDDRVILRRRGGEFWMYGTPWHGEAELAAPDKAPLKGIFLLGRGAENELVPLGQAEATARLLACGFPPFYSPEGLDFTLGFLEEVTGSVPCREIRFVPEGGVVDFIRRQ